MGSFFFNSVVLFSEHMSQRRDLGFTIFSERYVLNAFLEAKIALKMFWNFFFLIAGTVNDILAPLFVIPGRKSRDGYAVKGRKLKLAKYVLLLNDFHQTGVLIV